MVEALCLVARKVRWGAFWEIIILAHEEEH